MGLAEAFYRGGVMRASRQALKTREKSVTILSNDW
jgi:hypothetical protein